MSIDSSYEDIKKSLTDLYSYVSAPPSNIEQFTIMGPKPDSTVDATYAKDTNIPPEIKKYNIVPTELYSVVDNFDLEPSKLNDSEKALRTKYLNLLLQVIDDHYLKMYNQLNESDHPFKDLIKANSDASKNLTIRIIKLLIKEINPEICPEEKSTTPYIIAITSLSLLVLILLILYLTSGPSGRSK